MGAQERTEWSIGELAEAANVTVRTLRHYDHVGVLVPDDRSFGGHRRYCEAQVERLYRIVALRDLGFSLAEIATMLDADHGQLTETVRRQLRAVETEIESRMRLRERLARMLSRLERDQRLSAQDLIETMEEISMPITIDRVYTGTGDAGETELADGTRIPKTDPRLAAGDLEELAAHVGVAAARSEPAPELVEWLIEVQNDLLDIGAELVRGGGADDSVARVNGTYGDWLEKRCDEANQGLDALTSFVLAGDDPLVAQLHVCRTVCRRVERNVLATDHLNPEIARYLNRLSDLFFILARRAAAGGRERLWEPGRRQRAGSS